MAGLKELIADVEEVELDASEVSSVLLRVVLKDEGFYEIDAIKNVTIASNYHKSVSDVMTVSCIVPYSVYIKKLMANKDELIGELVFDTLVSFKGKKTRVKMKRNVAVYLDNDLDDELLTAKMGVSDEYLDMENPKELTLNCIDMEVIAMKRIIPTFSMKNTTIDSPIQYAFSKLVVDNNVILHGKPLLEEYTQSDYEEDSKKESESGGEVKENPNNEYIADVNAKFYNKKSKKIALISPPDNTNKYQNIFLDRLPGMEVDVTTIPQYLQQVYGVYNGGICSYYGSFFSIVKDDGGDSAPMIETMFVVKPKFDIRESMRDNIKAENGGESGAKSDSDKEKSKENEKRLKVVHEYVGDKFIDIYIPLPDNANRGRKYTYRTEDNGRIKIVGYSADKMRLDGGIDVEQKKSSITSTSANKGRKVTPYDVEVSDGVIKTKEAIYKVQGLNKMTDPKFTTALADEDVNEYEERSNLILNSGIITSITWRNSAPHLIRPCAPIAVHMEYKDKESDKVKIRKLFGNIMIANTGYRFKESVGRKNTPVYFTDTELIVILYPIEKMHS